MINFFSDDVRRDPYPVYERVRATSPVVCDPGTGLWMVFDYAGVMRVVSDHEAFSSKHGPADWLVFQDPPRQAKLRALISRAFTPRSVANLEGRIREIARGLLDGVAGRPEVDVALDFAVPLPMRVIAEMLGIPPEDRPRFVRWNDAILAMSYTVPAGKHGNPQAERAVEEFVAATGEMGEYLAGLLGERRRTPRDDLLTRLIAAEVDGERLCEQDILGFFQLLLLAGSETTTNLINSAALCFIENPEQLELLRGRMELLPSAIEEVLRYRSPLQWMFRRSRRDVSIGGQVIPAGKLVLTMIGSANRDPAVFREPERFDITREPNPHVAFGHGVHFCLGAPLARLESRVALTEFLVRFSAFGRVGDGPWEPRRGLHVHGPSRLPVWVEERQTVC
jgi:cytochrome P450